MHPGKVFRRTVAKLRATTARSWAVLQMETIVHAIYIAFREPLSCVLSVADVGHTLTLRRGVATPQAIMRRLRGNPARGERSHVA
jgi:hypothetical protein